MKINYEDIITKANTRKEALQNMEKMINDLPDMVESFTACLDYFIELGKLETTLDSEGKVIFGDKACHGIKCVFETAFKAKREFFTDPHGYGQWRLTHLVAMVEAQ